MNIKTKIPLLFYFWIFLSVITFVFIFIFFKGILQPLISSIVVSAIFYYIICRYACIVFGGDNKILIHYLLPFHENIEIEVDKIEDFNFKKGFLDFNESLENSTNFKIIFYDTIYLKKKEGNQCIKIHVRRGTFNKIKDYINEHLNVTSRARF